MQSGRFQPLTQSGIDQIHQTALRLLADSARNGAVTALAREGGLASTMWAGPGRAGPVSLKLGFAGEDCGYAVDLGLPQIGRSAFGLDPEIKAEAVWAGPWLRPSALIADRGGQTARIRDDTQAASLQAVQLDVPCRGEVAHDAGLNPVARRVRVGDPGT